MRSGGMIITIFGAKGGIGKTTLSTNLGTALVSMGAGKVVLVDVDTPVERSIVDVTGEIQGLDRDSIEKHLTIHSTGVRILPAPFEPVDWREVNNESLEKTLDLLAQTNDFVIVDSPGTFTDLVAVALERSHVILLVTSLDITSLRDATMALKLFNNGSYALDKIKLVVNHPTNVRFRDPKHVLRVAERIISPLGRRVDESSPYVDARLADGSRVNIIIPPVAPKSPTITIRKFRADRFTIQDLINVDTVSPELGEFFQACVSGRLNTLVSGGTGTGKTTLLNALSACIPATERVVTIEDPAELKLQQPHVVTLECRPANLEGKHEVTQRDLVRNALRMRPGRIIVSEVRGGEAFGMMQAMNTGHEGSLTTVHANSPRDALMRIENMILMTGFDLPLRAIREQMASAIHLVIQIARLVDGSRKVVSLSEVSGMESRTVTMQEIFRFQQHGLDDNGKVLGILAPTGIQPRFVERLAGVGVAFPAELFSPTARWSK